MKLYNYLLGLPIRVGLRLKAAALHEYHRYHS